tara:strand:- start:191 stop:655 length:465 start_codon:yes stop_codon:yes gene_type:complete
MEKTTNITELPIQSNIPTINASEMEDKIQPSPNQFMTDENVLLASPKKGVRFEDEQPPNVKLNQNKQIKKEKDIFTVPNEFKLIALASLLFFIFIDNKFKIYIINILMQVFGTFVKTETGGTSKTGNLFYSITFGLVLYLFTSFVDYTTIQFDF